MIKKSLLIILLTLTVLFWTSGATKDYVKIKTEQTENGFVLYASNSHFIPYTMELKFPVLTNLKSSVALPYRVVIPPETEKMKLVELTVIDKRKSSRVSSSYLFAMGDPDNAVHDDNYLYTIPFEHGTKHKIGQGFHGKATHNDLTNAYAVDFNMDIGTPICAARDGIVVETKEDSQVGGPHMSYADDANLITVYHSDGSFASYVHLKYNGVIVEVGDKVKTGQVIGYSGNTGRSSGPHLHFSVSLPDNQANFRSIPFKFLYKDGMQAVPEEGKYYYSFHKGGAEFEIESAEQISNEDYNDYLSQVKQNNKINLRAEQIEDTVIYFISNGFDQSVKVEVSMNLLNMKASKKLPITIDVPAGVEKFLVILTPINPAKPTQIKISYSYYK